MGAATDGRGGAHEADDGEEVGVQLVGGGDFPPGFRFHPTDEELVLYYLKRKICGRRIKLRMIGDVDVYKAQPWDLPERSLLKSGDKQWFFFSPRDRKYPNCSRSNRATKHGYWKATGKDRTISNNSKAVGNKKTLVYYHGRAPKGKRTDWVMYEYTLDEQVLMGCNNVQDSFALYKLFRKSGPGPKNGEQYGAPFIDDESEDDVPSDSFKNQTNFGDQPHFQSHPVNRVFNNGECLSNRAFRRDQSKEHLLNQQSDGSALNEERSTLPNYDLENIFLQLSNELDMVPERYERSSSVPKANTGADMGHTSYTDVVHTQQTNALRETNPQTVPLSSATYVQPIETSEGRTLLDEEFLEIRDLNDVGDTDILPVSAALIDPDDYFDAQMFMDELMEPDGLNKYWNDFRENKLQNEVTGPVHELNELSYWDGFNVNEIQNETIGPAHGLNEHSYWNGFSDNAMQNEASSITTELWTNEQFFNVSTAVESNQLVTASSASSGLLYDNGNNVTSPSESWFGSKLSAFLDSVPSSPAFASENSSIARAFERVSSFRVTQNQDVRDLLAVPLKRQGGQNRGFLFISFLVGIGAVFWILTIGATIKVVKGFWGRYISS